MEDLILTPGADDKRRQLVKVCVIFLILSSVRVQTMLCSTHNYPLLGSDRMRITLAPVQRKHGLSLMEEK
jgi:hypothetical protein